VRSYYAGHKFSSAGRHHALTTGEPYSYKVTQITDIARKALGLTSDRYEKAQTAQGVMPDGRPVKLVPSPVKSGRRGMLMRRIQILCDRCNRWIPVGRILQHEGSGTCYRYRVAGRTTRDPSSKKRRFALHGADINYVWGFYLKNKSGSWLHKGTFRTKEEALGFARRMGFTPLSEKIKERGRDWRVSKVRVEDLPRSEYELFKSRDPVKKRRIVHGRAASSSHHEPAVSGPSYFTVDVHDAAYGPIRSYFKTEEQAKKYAAKSRRYGATASVRQHHGKMPEHEERTYRHADDGPYWEHDPSRKRRRLARKRRLKATSRRDPGFRRLSRKAYKKREYHIMDRYPPNVRPNDKWETWAVATSRQEALELLHRGKTMFPHKQWTIRMY
jgi:hypothetical protein